jgi:hypothetical protein
MEARLQEAANCAAIQELPSILWNPKVHYSVHKSPPLSLSWPRSIQSIPSHRIYLRSILILSTHLSLCLHSGPLLTHWCYMPCLPHPPWLIILIMLGEEYKLWIAHNKYGRFCLLCGQANLEEEIWKPQLTDLACDTFFLSGHSSLY